MGEIKVVLDISERRTGRAMQQPRSTQRYQPLKRNDEEPLTQRITTLAAKYDRYGYRRIIPDQTQSMVPLYGGSIPTTPFQLLLHSPYTTAIRKRDNTKSSFVHCFFNLIGKVKTFQNIRF